MPNRIIKESAFLSDTVAALSDFEFRLWVGLLTYVDDAGRGDARPAVIKGRIFALRDRVTVKDIDTAVHGLADKGCISLYTVGGKSYFYFPTWSDHQRIRDVKPKYPAPEESDGLCHSAADCGELPQIAADCGLNPNPNPNPNPNTKEERKARATPFSPPTVAEVEVYCRERGNSIDAERFVDFYTAKGWKVGAQQMRDWKAAVRTWEKREGNGSGETACGSAEPKQSKRFKYGTYL